MYDWYRNAIATNFWAITPENLFKWPEYEPEQGAWQQAAQTLQQLYIDFAQVGMGLRPGPGAAHGSSSWRCVQLDVCSLTEEAPTGVVQPPRMSVGSVHHPLWRPAYEHEQAVGHSPQSLSHYYNHCITTLPGSSP